MVTPTPPSPNLGSYVTSIIRTGVPYLVGFLVTWLIRQGWVSDSSVAQPLTELLTFVIGTAYYLVVRALETVVPGLGWLLGVPAQPVYGQSDATYQNTLTTQLPRTGDGDPGRM